MAIVEGKDSTIDSTTEATAMANAALADLKQPLLALSVTCGFLYGCELGDLHRFVANGQHFAADQDLAVVTFAHELTPDSATTTVGVRGKPVASVSDWLRMEARSSGETAAPIVPASPTGVALVPAPRGVVVDVVPSAVPPLAESWELHLSTATGFTPSASTLKARGRQTRFELSDLTPGTRYYMRVVAVDAEGNRSAATSEQSVVAGYVQAADLMPGVDYGTWPPNGDWEDWADASAPPNAWIVGTGAVGPGSVQWWRQDASYTGGSPAGTYTLGARPYYGWGTIASAPRSVAPGQEVTFSSKLTAANFGSVGACRIRLTIVWQDLAGADVGYATQDFNVTAAWGLPADVGNPGDVTMRGIAPATASQFRVAFENYGKVGASDTIHVLIHYARASVGQPWHYVGASGEPIYNNGWLTLGGPTQGAAFQLRSGMVHLRGWIYNGSNNYIFQLPPGLRPEVDMGFATWKVTPTGADQGNIFVQSDGWVYSIGIGASGYSYRLDGISFIAAQ
jgi:hypothetical protein